MTTINNNAMISIGDARQKVADHLNQHGCSVDYVWLKEDSGEIEIKLQDGAKISITRIVHPPGFVITLS